MLQVNRWRIGWGREGSAGCGSRSQTPKSLISNQLAKLTASYIKQRTIFFSGSQKWIKLSNLYPPFSESLVTRVCKKQCSLLLGWSLCNSINAWLLCCTPETNVMLCVNCNWKQRFQIWKRRNKETMQSYFRGKWNILSSKPIFSILFIIRTISKLLFQMKKLHFFITHSIS